MTREIISNHGDLVPRKGKESLNDLHKTTPVKAALQGAALTVVTLFGGLLGFGPITITLTVSLGFVETMAGNNILGQIPIHRLFTLLFVPAAFLISGVSSWAIGRGYKETALARRLFWQVGLAAAVTFLAVNLSLESFGMVVGAPGAAQRATMVTVLISGNVSAALVGGGVLGLILAGKK